MYNEDEFSEEPSAISQPYSVGKMGGLGGCFTEENFIRGLTGREIGIELGLQPRQTTNGIFIAWAIQLPDLDGFEPGGWTEFSTDNFMEYIKTNDGIVAKWIREKYEKTYSKTDEQGRSWTTRMPISIEEVKKGLLSNMRHTKLVKALPVAPYDENIKFPPGGKASQIVVMKDIHCMIDQFLKPNEVFRGIFR